MIIINAKIYTMDVLGVIENGFVEFENGLITKIGQMDDFLGEAVNILDADGKILLPGLIDAHCHIGLVEDGLGFEGEDLNEETDPLTPHLRAIDAINPQEESFKEAFEAGITTVVTGPGSANVMGGSFCAINTYGICVDDMVIKENVAIKIAFGENPKSVYHGKGQAPVTRMSTAALLREQLIKAREYLSAMDLYNQNSEENDKPEFDMKCESLIPVMRKEIPLKAHAHRCDDIFSAIRIAKEFDLNLTLEHCTEGHLIADRLKKEGYPCTVGPILSDRSKPELKNLNIKMPKIMSEAGIDIAIMTDHPETPVKYLPLCAAIAYREGMDYYKVLESITINPAKNCGIDNIVGSIKVGKQADMVLFSKDPLDISSSADAVFIKGIKVK